MASCVIIVMGCWLPWLCGVHECPHYYVFMSIFLGRGYLLRVFFPHVFQVQFLEPFFSSFFQVQPYNRKYIYRSIGHRVWPMSLNILTELSVN